MRPWISEPRGSCGRARSRRLRPRDVLVLATALREPHGYAESATSGRFVLATGAILPVQIDGADVIARAPWGSSVEAFGGAAGGPALRGARLRLARRRARRADGRAQGDLGVSYIQRREDGEISNEEVGADLAAAPAPWLDLAANGAYDLTSPGIADARVSAAARLGGCAPRALRVRAVARPAAAGDVALLGARRLSVADPWGARCGGEPRRGSTCSRAAPVRSSAVSWAATGGSARRSASTTAATAASASRCAGSTSPDARGRAFAPSRASRSARVPLLDRDRDRRARRARRARRRVALGTHGALVAVAHRLGGRRRRPRRPRRPSTLRGERPRARREDLEFTVRGHAHPRDAPLARARGVRGRARPPTRGPLAPVRAPRARAQGHQLRRVPRGHGDARARRDALHLPTERRLPSLPPKPHDEHSCSGCHGESYVREAAELAREHLRFEHGKHMAVVNGDCVRCHTAVAEARPEALLPKMATCFGCHEHRDQWTLRDCDGCHVDLAARGHAAREPPRPRRRLDPRARRSRRERARSLLELPHRAVVRGVPRRGDGPRAAREARVRRRVAVRPSSRRLPLAARRGGARRPGTVHDLPQRELVRRLPHGDRMLRPATTSLNPHPPGWITTGRGGRRARRAGAHRPGVVRGLPRRRRRAALRRLPSRRRTGRQPARARLLEHQEQDARPAVSALPRGGAVTRRGRGILWTVLAVTTLLIAGAWGLVARWPSSPPGIPPEMVPASWEEFRTSLGHRQHVGKDGVACKDCHDYEREGFKNPGAAPCQRCHSKESGRHHGSGGDAKNRLFDLSHLLSRLARQRPSRDCRVHRLSCSAPGRTRRDCDPCVNRLQHMPQTPRKRAPLHE